MLDEELPPVTSDEKEDDVEVDGQEGNEEEDEDEDLILDEQAEAGEENPM